MPKAKFEHLYRRDTRSVSISLIAHAQEAIEFMIDRGGFFAGNKAEFALAMGHHPWIDDLNGPVDKPNRRLVEDVCNLTRDQNLCDDDVREILGGYVVAYSPSQGGMTLIDPEGEQTSQQIVHMIVGDLQKQQAIRTMMRRRMPSWETLGVAAVNSGDHEMARLWHEGLSEIRNSGFVSIHISNEIYKALRVRGLVDA